MIRINIVDEEFIEVTLVEIQRKRCNNNWYGRSKNLWIFQTRSSVYVDDIFHELQDYENTMI